MPKLVANTTFTYATRALKPGDAFEASRQDARVLTAIGRARPCAEEPIAPEVESTAVETLAAQNVEPEPQAKPVGAVTRRTYKRRDLNAEE